MADFLTQFHFLRPGFLLLVLPLLLAIGLQWRRQALAARWQRLLPEHLKQVLLVGERNWRQMLPLRLLLLVMLLLIGVLAGPTWQRQPSPFAEDQAPLVLVLDASSSMAQTDLAPSRLERAKLKLQDILAERDGAPTALIVYAGSAHTVLPLSTDSAVFEPMLPAIKPGIVPRTGKFAEQALPLIERELADSPVPGTVLLLTDGIGSATAQRFTEYFTAQQPDAQKQLLILGVGPAQASAQGDFPLQHKALDTMAKASGGKYRTIEPDNSDVAWVVDQIEQYLVINADQSHPWQDMGYYLLYPIALLSLLWFRRGWAVQWGRAASVLLVVLASGFATPDAQAADWRFADLWLTPDQQGQAYFKLEDYATAAERFDDPLWKGVAYYYNEDFKLAQEYFSRVDSPQAMFNVANALAQGREYVAARDIYNALLELDPEYPGAENNRDYLQRIIDEINLLSESQQAEKGESSHELGDEPQTADGADREFNREQLIEEEPITYSAEQLQSDQALHEKWMRQVQPDPSRFLSAKFYIQLEQREQQPQTKQTERQP